MPRYYVLQAGAPGESASIVGVIVVAQAELDSMFSPDPYQTEAGEIAGPTSFPGRVLLTRDELLARPDGRSALFCWEAGDDDQYEEDIARMLREATADDVRMAVRDGDPRAAEIAAKGFPYEEARAFLDEYAHARSRRDALQLVRTGDLE